MVKEYIGVSAFGIEMGAITPNTDLEEEIIKTVKKCENDGLIHSGDILCVTESIVARAQGNYVDIDEVSKEVLDIGGIEQDSTVLVLFPITSRNRFSPILRSIARAVNNGKVILQMNFPDDEVGNRVVKGDLDPTGLYKYSELKGLKEDKLDFIHPITKLNYLEFYENIIEEEGASADIYLSNDPKSLLGSDLDSVIVSSIHSREKDLEEVRKGKREINGNFEVISLKDICSKGKISCKWGLIGSNLSSSEKIKLAPKNPFKFVENLQAKIKNEIGKELEVLIYGDGAYKDPESGIYELADPVTAFGYTDGIEGKLRRGSKYKYLVDKYLDLGYENEEIDKMIRSGKVEEDEGTTPRKLKDLIASLSDLISGSADAGTPLVLVKNFL